jgi:aminomethyltransferase
MIKQKEQGLPTRLIGFESAGRLIPRQGFSIMAGSQKVGEVRSGTFGPTVQKPIGLAFVESAFTDAADLAVDIRGQQVPISRVKLPFSKRPKEPQTVTAAK